MVNLPGPTVPAKEPVLLPGGYPKNRFDLPRGILVEYGTPILPDPASLLPSSTVEIIEKQGSGAESTTYSVRFVQEVHGQYEVIRAERVVVSHGMLLL